MSNNYERLLGCSIEQMEIFIDSLVKKPISAYVDWNAWLRAEDPNTIYIGSPAFKKENGQEIGCRFLREHTNEDGILMRTYYLLLEDGSVREETVEAGYVRLSSEEEYMPLPETFKEDNEMPETDEKVDDIAEENEPEVTSDTENTDEIPVFEEAVSEAEAEIEPEPETAEAEESTEEIPVFTEEVEPVSVEETAETLSKDTAEAAIESMLEETEAPAEDTSSYAVDQFLSAVKEDSPLFDPNDPEDLELPTIVFTGIADDKERFNM